MSEALRLIVVALVVNKRKLPAILRNEVPPLRIAGTAVASLVASPNRMWGFLHSDIGKQIKHDGQTAVITNVHTDLRQLEINKNRFWVPRRSVSRREFKEERTNRRIRTAFVPPCYTGDSRPAADVVPLPQWDKMLTQRLYDFAKYISRLHGIEMLPESNWSNIRWRMLMQRPTRQERKDLEQNTRRKYGSLKDKLRERVLRQILAGSRLPDAKQFAVYDVLALGQPIEQVAEARRLAVGSLENTVERITTKTNQAYKQALQVA